MQICGLFDDPTYGRFDSAIYDCRTITNIPTRIDVTTSRTNIGTQSISERNKSTTSTSERTKSTHSTSERNKPTSSTSKTHKSSTSISE